jgi:hypothetical protein
VSIYNRLGLYFTLIAFNQIDTAPFETAALKLGVQLDMLKLRQAHLRPMYERNLLLVRPDQHIAWREDALPNDPIGLLQRVIGR